MVSFCSEELENTQNLSVIQAAFENCTSDLVDRFVCFEEYIVFLFLINSSGRYGCLFYGQGRIGNCRYSI